MLGRIAHRHLVLPAFETLYKRRDTLSIWKELERSQWDDRGSVEERQIQSLQALLRHAFDHSPYYGNQWQKSGICPEQIQNLNDFQALPILTKADIRSRHDDLLASGVNERLITKSTGGSTGVPLRFQLNMGSHERRCAATLRGYEWAGAGPGSNQLHLWGVPLLQRSKAQVWKDRIYDRLQRRTMVNCFELSEVTAFSIMRRINRRRPDSIVAYTNAIYQLARMLEEQNLTPFAPRSIVVGAEKLHPFQRELIERVFRAPVFETYGSREFMLIGAECDQHSGLHLTSEHLVVEIVDDNGRPTPNGQTGNVVVTDLFNYGMPFIRYQTGDMAVAGFETCRCGRSLPLLRSVTGRQLDVLRTIDGRTIPGEFFPHLLKDYSGIRQFQVVQHDPEHIDIKVVTGATWREEHRAEIVTQIHRTAGSEMQVNWIPVDHIPLTAAGKHRVVVSHLDVATHVATHNLSVDSGAQS